MSFDYIHTYIHTYMREREREELVIARCAPLLFVSRDLLHVICEVVIRRSTGLLGLICIGLWMTVRR